MKLAEPPRIPSALPEGVCTESKATEPTTSRGTAASELSAQYYFSTSVTSVFQFLSTSVPCASRGASNSARRLPIFTNYHSLFPTIPRLQVFSHEQRQLLPGPGRNLLWVGEDGVLQGGRTL